MRKLSIGAGHIQAAYDALGHQWGWSLLAGPESHLYTAETIIVGLNPARTQDDSPESYCFHWDVPEGNIYFDENWSGRGKYSPLQRQLLEWHRLLNLGPTQTIGANFAPFRSRNWAELASPKESVRFAEALWQDVVNVTPAKLFITMGKDPAWYLSRVMGAKSFTNLPAGESRQSTSIIRPPAAGSSPCPIQ